MAESSEDWRARLSELRVAYAQHLPERIAAIEAAWQGALGETDVGQALQTAVRLAHNLVGSAGTHGFADVSTSARQLEHRLNELQERGVPPSEATAGEIEEMLAALAEATQQLGGGETDDPTQPVAPEEQQHDDVGDGNKLIFVIDEPSDAANHLARQLGHFDNGVTVYLNLTTAKNAFAATLPGVIVCDPRVFDNGCADMAALNEIADAAADQGAAAAPPFIVISAHDDFATRLAAARAGTRAYLTKPVDVYGLTEKLDALTKREQPEPFRVLVVDDSKSVSEFYSMVLQQAGMVTSAISDPMLAIDALMGFDPDLILMDVYMPGYTGPELAAVVRQQSAYVRVPIVFLSSEVDRDKQLSALSLGGDEFITKPVQPDHLVSAVRARADRWRMVRSSMARDSLTGLANHTRITGRLGGEVARCVDGDGELAFALIDIDHFRSVNETYGYAAGDRVIKCLSRVLRDINSRLDVTGRYGGEEFAVILPDSDGATSVQRFDELRECFAQIHQITDEGDFSVTISCGISTFPHFGDVASLVSSAERALEKAKRAGRNRVVTAGV